MSDRQTTNSRTLRRLIGGPQDGLVAPTSGKVPVILLGEGRRESFLDEVEGEGEALWDPVREWYTAREPKPKRARRS